MSDSKPYSVDVSRSTNKEKKLMAVFEDKDGKKVKTTHFGSRGMSDYTKHGDKDRMELYKNRHKKNEHWNRPMTAGSLSKNILWNKPSLTGSFADYKKKFRLKGNLKVSRSADTFESQTTDMLISYVEVVHPDDDYLQEQLMNEITSGRTKISYEDMQNAIQSPSRRRIVREMMAAEKWDDEERNTRWKPDWIDADGKMSVPKDSYIGTEGATHWTDLPYYTVSYSNFLGTQYELSFLESMDRGSDFADVGTIDFSMRLAGYRRVHGSEKGKPLSDNEIRLMKDEILESAFRYGLPIEHPKEIAFTDIDRENKSITFNVQLPPSGSHGETKMSVNQTLKGCLTNNHHGGAYESVCDWCGKHDEEWGNYLPMWMMKYPPHYAIREIPDITGEIQADSYGENDYGLPFYFYLTKYADEIYDIEHTDDELKMLIDRVDAWFTMNGITGLQAKHEADNVYWAYLPLDYTLFVYWKNFWGAGIMNNSNILLDNRTMIPKPIVYGDGYEISHDGRHIRKVE